ncbi:hypothetical protein GV791_15035 [Nocardia cyriacigeorgica]|uniref:Uncharacterized protein n=1 Tax=Nocardia cyriacigeorgica TaxID=135487 RepID=A0A6P1CN25_9NOCA|nr:hypothetical protein [Nocardia cyriacigeorgica]NEW33868.1 hypothetical protein [Nocardia cyriacigeorgica]
MTSKSRQAGQLAYQLSQRIGGSRVDIAYHGPRRDWYGGWHVEWADGPTLDEMRALIAEQRHRFPVIASTDLRYNRGNTDLAEAVAVLLHLDQHPGERSYLDSTLAVVAFDRTSYPERAGEVWQQRGRALLAAGGGIYYNGPSLDALRHRMRDGWDAVLEWLDGNAAVATGRHLEVVR